MTQLSQLPKLGSLSFFLYSSLTSFIKDTFQFLKISMLVGYGMIYLLCLFLFIFLSLAALGLCCCTWVFCSCGEQGLLFVPMRGLLIVVASLVAEPGL